VKFDSAFSPKTLKTIRKRTVTKTTLNLTLRFWRQRSAMLRAFRRKRGVIENFEYLGKFEEYFRKCWLYCVLHLLVIERCKESFKTGYENLVHVLSVVTTVLTFFIENDTEKSCVFKNGSLNTAL
jgi:hypothetical protein